MKDWKAEYQKVKGQMVELERERNRYRDQIEARRYEAESIRDKFKELLIEVLGRNS